MRDSWPRQIILGLLPLLLGIELLAAVVFVPMALGGNADFRQFYAGGYILRAGLRRDLYRPSIEREVEDRVVSPMPRALPINHPAYEYLFFVPLSLLSYRAAYLVWLAINVSMLIVCGIFLARILDPWLTGALFIGFAPLATTLMQGQDTIWLFFFFLLSFSCETEFMAGVLLGLGAFRFHVIIPVMLLYLLWRRWRFVCGALLSSGLLAVISVLLIGVHGWLEYIHTAAYGIEVRNGPASNVYGLTQAVLGSHSHLAFLLAASCALVAFIYASRQTPSLETAILVIPLASYYLMLHDLIILLIPITLRIRRTGSIFQFVAPICGLFPQFAFLCGIPSALLLYEG